MVDVITIGSATRDVFLKSPLFKVLKDPEHLEKIGFETGEAQCFALGSKIAVETMVRTTGGDAANAAVTFARQGFHTAMIAKVGSDEIGREIVRELAQEKISILNPHHKGDTDYSTILLSPNGERTILVHRGAPIAKKEISFSHLKAAWAYIAPANISPVLMKEIVQTLKKNNISIALNPSRYYIERAHKELAYMIANARVVITNREEAAAITGENFSDEKRVFKKFDAMVDGIAIMTDGARGAIASDGQTAYRCGTFKEKEMVDRTGAGDAFGAGFVSGFIRSNDICYGLRLGAANATSVVEYIGGTEGILDKKDFEQKRWKFLNLDVEPFY